MLIFLIRYWTKTGPGFKGIGFLINQIYFAIDSFLSIALNSFVK
jgi:hypothetical protein